MNINEKISYCDMNNGTRHFHFGGTYSILGGCRDLHTDADMDFEILSDNFGSYLLETSEKCRYFKVGCTLEIPDEEHIYAAPIDNTLYLFNDKNRTNPMNYISGTRVTKSDLIAKHLSLYKNYNNRKALKSHDAKFSNYKGN